MCMWTWWYYRCAAQSTGCGCTSGLGGCWACNPQKPIGAASGRRERAEPCVMGGAIAALRRKRYSPATAIERTLRAHICRARSARAK
ncbi:hypothetical protein BD311DRAFT_767540 [Dichomitus squalens]|uniref:Uncharacterized protein n=1 Tax=Dichomitus squalens TaxID=114155 RepID=A0A4Q9MCC4_9APHY|nr:hypothetical protein BD311DRAFT_767540 [Dichomitus squalens]